MARPKNREKDEKSSFSEQDKKEKTMITLIFPLLPKTEKEKEAKTFAKVGTVCNQLVQDKNPTVDRFYPRWELMMSQ